MVSGVKAVRIACGVQTQATPTAGITSMRRPSSSLNANTGLRMTESNTCDSCRWFRTRWRGFTNKRVCGKYQRHNTVRCFDYIPIKEVKK
jgi:hypothetical protein